MALHKLPDIDIVFAQDRQDGVVNLIFARYGPQHAAIVAGFNTYQGRAAVADIAKVLGASEFQIRSPRAHPAHPRRSFPRPRESRCHRDAESYP